MTAIPCLFIFLPATLYFCPRDIAQEIRPFALVKPLAAGQAHWTSGFWAERFDMCRTQTILAIERIIRGTNYSHFLHNFEIAAGLAEGRHRGGGPFNDGDVYKWIEAATATLAVQYDENLEARLDEIIALVSRAQRGDGYIHTPILIKQRAGEHDGKPFQDRHAFELYNMGHLMIAASLHHQITRKSNLLEIACRVADLLWQTFENMPPEGARSSVCPSHYMGLLDLYRTTCEKRYLDLARRIFRARAEITTGSDDNQD